MMETKAILWEIPGFRKPFPCFVGGCKKEAQHMRRFMHGNAVVQVCLCDECLKRSPASILRSLSLRPKNFDWERNRGTRKPPRNPVQ